MKIKMKIKIPENDLLSSSKLECVKKRNLNTTRKNCIILQIQLAFVHAFWLLFRFLAHKNGMIKINDSIRIDMYQKSIFDTHTHTHAQHND